MPLAVYYLNQAMTAVSIQDELQALRSASLYRRLRRVENDQGPTLILDGREVINFSSNNYLGIANHPALAQAAKQAIDRYGCGAGASRLISGNMALHEELENRLAKFKGTEAALVFNSGFQANTGILSALTGETDAVLVQMGTLGKALGGFGAYVAGSRALRELLINRCRSFIFTTALPPAIMATALAAIDLVEHKPERREALWSNCRQLVQGLKEIGFSLGEIQSPILPLIIGDAENCMRLSEQLLERGVFAQGIRPPTVPAGTSRLRISFMATHTRQHTEKKLEHF